MSRKAFPSLVTRHVTLQTNNQQRYVLGSWSQKTGQAKEKRLELPLFVLVFHRMLDAHGWTYVAGGALLLLSTFDSFFFALLALAAVVHERLWPGW